MDLQGKGQRPSDLARLLAERDIAAQRGEFLFALPSALTLKLASILEDKRDLPAALLIANVALTTLPAAVAMVALCHSHLAGLIYLVANYVCYLQRFMLTLHFTQHRRLFKKELGWLSASVPYVLCTLFGVPSGLYRPHHCIMHHTEDNRSTGDISSTERFQRDNFMHFLGYWCRYWIGAWFELPAYALKRQRYKLAASTVLSEVLYWGALSVLWRLNPVATLWCWIVPFLLSSFLFMFGNWSQHVFVTPGGSTDAYGMTYNCLACPDNRLTYNDGYHIMHHLNSRLHWSELPAQFIATVAQHGERDALVFQGIGFFDVGLSVFTGRLGFLADHVVPCNERQAQRKREEWIVLLRERLQPVKRAESLPDHVVPSKPGAR